MKCGIECGNQRDTQSEGGLDPLERGTVMQRCQRPELTQLAQNPEINRDYVREPITSMNNPVGDRVRCLGKRLERRRYRLTVTAADLHRSAG
jgi:hypothetical protein